ncbi:MAG TPA: hypothetical protein VKM93_06450 [Terriglobia bacterium]|nr:hypothetical protein [Terriglobia bacterium]
MEQSADLRSHASVAGKLTISPRGRLAPDPTMMIMRTRNTLPNGVMSMIRLRISDL